MARDLPLTPAGPNATEAQTAKRLALGFYFLAAVTYVLIVLGALVRANGAGLACPDWPLCFGEVIPEFDVKVAFEWGHRALAGSVGLVYLALGAFTLRLRTLGPRMRAGLIAAGIVLALQVILGGLTVLQLLAVWTVTSHLVTGNAFALAVVFLGRRLTRLASGDPPRPKANETQRNVTTLAGALLLTQIVLGGLLSSNYAGLVCPDWPTCMNGEYFPTFRGVQGLHIFHRITGYSVVLAIAAAAWLARSHAPSRRWLQIATAFAVAQVFVGVANVLLRLPIEITALHSALAAGLVCTVGVSVRESWREPNEA